MTSAQKLKPIYIMDYLLKNSDEEHPVTLKQILAYLESKEIPAERKSVYLDIEALRDYGLDVIQNKSGKNTKSAYYDKITYKLKKTEFVFFIFDGFTIFYVCCSLCRIVMLILFLEEGTSDAAFFCSFFLPVDIYIIILAYIMGISK